MGRTLSRESLLERLEELGIPVEMRDGFPELPDDVVGLLIYGSRARGDHEAGSDLDVLALASESGPTLTSADVSVAVYTREQLLTGIGTLFGAHLKRDSKMVWDPSGEFGDIIANMGEVDSSRLLARARAMSVLFTTPDRDLPQYLAGISRQARYLLRSCLYAQAIAAGEPCFSVRELAIRYKDPDLARLLASRQDEAPSAADLASCLRRLSSIIGPFPLNAHGSLEATLVNEWGTPSDVLSMAYMALGLSGGSDYEEVEKILL